MTRVRCYYDGFNFYYGICRSYDIKWIDLEKLLKTLLRELIGDEVIIEKLLFFTSTVSGEPNDRQKIYLKALEQHSGSRIQIIQGAFHKRKRKIPIIKRAVKEKTTRQENGKESLVKITMWKGDKREKVARQADSEENLAEIMTWEEKQTDVNIACQIVDDAHVWANNEESERRYDVTCLISNDSDFSSALQIKSRLQQPIFLITPVAEGVPPRISPLLTKYVLPQHRVSCIKRKDVEGSLLPPRVGQYTPPDAPGWGISK